MSRKSSAPFSEFNKIRECSVRLMREFLCLFISAMFVFGQCGLCLHCKVFLSQGMGR